MCLDIKIGLQCTRKFPTIPPATKADVQRHVAARRMVCARDRKSFSKEVHKDAEKVVRSVCVCVNSCANGPDKEGSVQEHAALWWTVLVCLQDRTWL